MISGVVLVHKPQDMTSHDAVALMRKAYGMKKVGHTGTLDPNATGVLPICLGFATKLSDYLMTSPKTYRCAMTLGQETDTQDRWGDVVSRSPYHHISETQLIEALMGMVGEIAQVPPMYSAIRIKGQRLHKIARRGEEVHRTERIRTIYEMNVISIDWPQVIFDVTCSKGTYVRTLCHDVGKMLGTVAHMHALERIESGGFRIDECTDPFEILASEKKERFIISMTEVVSRMSMFGRIDINRLNNKSRALFEHGVRLNIEECIGAKIEDGYQQYIVYFDEELFGIAQKTEKGVHITTRLRDEKI